MGDKAGTTIELAEGDIQPIEGHLASADTLRQWGAPTLLQRIRSIARGRIGQKEDPRYKNWGNVVTDAATPLIKPERLALFAPDGPKAGKFQWCAAEAWDCVHEGLVADKRPPEQLREWKRLGSAEVDVFWDRLAAAGLVVRHVPGTPPPADAILIFFRNLAHVEIYDGSVGILHVSIGGNSGPKADQVYENKNRDDDPDIFGFGRLPW